MDKNISYGDDFKYIPVTSVGSGQGVEVLPDLYCHTIQIVNIVLIGKTKSNDFVLVDTGTPKSANKILSVVEERFGPNSKPKAIILTHGHFDHIGAVIELVQKWDIPVYAHILELPFLTGKKNYPPPDPTVEGGLVANMSAIFPNESIHLGEYVRALPTDGTVPHMPQFQWIHTPGHSPGHISLFRDNDKALIAGDAFVTVKQDSLYKVFTQDMEMNGPPRYFTSDWDAAWEFVKKLEALQPAVAVTGHGKPISGEQLAHGLKILVNEFEKRAIPDYGRYVNKRLH